MKKFIFPIFLLNIAILSHTFCMEKNKRSKAQHPLICLGILAGSESEYDNSKFIKENLADRDNEYQQENEELVKKLNYFQQTFGSLEDTLIINSRLSISSKVIFWGGLSLIGLNRLLPLASQALEKFWRLNPRLSFLTSCLGFGASGFGILMLLMYSGHSKCLKEYKEATLNSQYLANLKPYLQEDTNNNKEEGEEEKKTQ